MAVLAARWVAAARAVGMVARAEAVHGVEATAAAGTVADLAGVSMVVLPAVG